MTPHIDDETLTAYVDGELDAASARDVKAALLRDPALRRRARRLAGSAEALRGALDELLLEPVPAQITDVLAQSGPTGHRHASPRLAPLALAASVALVVGSLSGFWFAAPGDDAGVSPAWDGALRAAAAGALDTTPSGAVRALAPGSAIQVQPLLSFRDTHGRICRQYTVTVMDSAADAVACRTQDGGWQLQFASPRALAQAPAQSTFAPAAGSNAGRFDTVVETLIAEPIAPDAEHRLIDSGWR